MQTSQEIRSNLNNIKYYAKKLQELTKFQFGKDVDAGHLLGINTSAGGVRFDSLGAMQTATEWINIYCDNIEANLKNAEAQDEKLRLPDEEEQKSENTEEAETPEEFR